MNKTEINEIDIGNLIVININNNLYDSCSNFTYPLQGHYLIKFDNCEISINEYKILRYESRLNTIIPNFNKLPSNITEILPDINFTHVSEIMDNIENKQNNHNYLLYTLIFIFIIFILYYLLRKSSFVTKYKICKGIRGDSNLNGGGVICDDHINDMVILPMSLHT